MQTTQKNIYDTIISVLHKNKLNFTQENLNIDTDILKLSDKYRERIDVTFVTWTESNRVSIFLDTLEILDEDIDNLEDLVVDIITLLSSKVSVKDTYVSDKLIRSEFEYCMLIDSEIKKFKSYNVNNFSFASIFGGNKIIKKYEYQPWITLKE